MSGSNLIREEGLHEIHGEWGQVLNYQVLEAQPYKSRPDPMAWC